MAKTRALEETLGKLHESLADHLLEKMKSGEATASDLQAAIKFLKDNNITSAIVPGDKLDGIKDALPIFSDEDEDVYA